MEHLSFYMKKHELNQVDKLVEEDPHFDDRSQALRYLIRQGLQREAIEE